jgi:enoyl-CoA hydratase
MSDSSRAETGASPDPSYEEIRYEEQGRVRLITIDRPQRMNAIGPVTSRELIDAWGRFRDDDDAYVAVITGAGSEAFCAGADLKSAAAAAFGDPEGAERPLVDWTPEEVAAHERGERDGIIGPSRWTDIYKPIIAAVNGVAYAGGLEWACFADIRIADEHASFGVTCRRWNVGLGDGGTQRLPRIVGMGRAMELIITGRVIDAREAESIGLVNEVTPSGRCAERALELAAEIAALPQPAIRTDKEAAVRGYGRPLEEGLLIEARCFNRLLDTPELAEGVRQFVERDHPDRAPGGDSVTPGLVRSQRPR